MYIIAIFSSLFDSANSEEMNINKSMTIRRWLSQTLWRKSVIGRNSLYNHYATLELYMIV